MASVERMAIAAANAPDLYSFEPLVIDAVMRYTRPAQPLLPAPVYPKFLQWRARVAVLQDLYNLVSEEPLDLSDAKIAPLLAAVHTMDVLTDELFVHYLRFFKTSGPVPELPVARCELLRATWLEAKEAISRDAASGRPLLRVHNWEQMALCDVLKHGALIMANRPKLNGEYLCCC